jgi:ribonucleoside-diphosphate reductase alpha chain
LVKIYNEHWCEHKTSCTIYYRDDEFLDVAAWIWKHFNDVSGISLLPRDDHIYKQAPYQPIDKSEYQTLLETIPKLDMEAFAKYEVTDNTTSSQEFACTGNSCEFS